MKKSEIALSIELDDNNVPEQIFWSATDKEDEGLSETKSFSLSLWDHLNKNTMRIDLWTKEMPVDEMKRFYIDTIGGIAQSVLNSTGDEFMSNELNAICEKFIKHVKEENEKAGQ